MAKKKKPLPLVMWYEIEDAIDKYDSIPLGKGHVASLGRLRKQLVTARVRIDEAIGIIDHRLRNRPRKEDKKRVSPSLVEELSEELSEVERPLYPTGFTARLV